jgi:hypothetical protein
MGHHANESAEHDVGETERPWLGHELSEPIAIRAVPGGVFSMCIDKDVDVEEDQPSRSIRSSRAALSSRSTPGWRPVPR